MLWPQFWGAVMSPSLCILLLLLRPIELLISQLLSCPYPASWACGTVISSRGQRGLLMLLSTEPWASSCLMLIVTHGCVRWTRSSYLQSVSFKEPRFQPDKDRLSCLEKRLWPKKSTSWDELTRRVLLASELLKSFKTSVTPFSSELYKTESPKIH